MADMDHEGDIEEGEDTFDFHLPIQNHSRPISRVSGDLAINSDLTTIDIDETDIDQALMAVARNLGLEIPEEPIERKPETLSPQRSSVTISSINDEPSILQSRTSNSTRPTSIESEEEKITQTPKPTHIPIESLLPATIPLPGSHPLRRPSLAPSRAQSYSRAPSIAPSTVAESVTSTSRSVFSMSSISKHSSVASSFTKSIRRLSGFSKRKSMEVSQPSQPDIATHTPHLGLLRGRTVSTPQLNRSMVSEHVRPRPARNLSTLSAPPANVSGYMIPRTSVGTILPTYAESRGKRPSIRRPLTPTLEEEDYEGIRLAQERSLRSSHLQKLRATQLEEQARFEQEHYLRQRKLQIATKESWQKAQDVHDKRRDETIAKHEKANSELETRHLNAEMELERLLTSQRRACETKLKYMEAYCRGTHSGEHSVEVQDEIQYPTRQVTEDDYRKLVEQYHLKNGMKTLHNSRIHVLREQQAQQATRISARQDGELEGLTARHEREEIRLKAEAMRSEAHLKREYSNKKARLIWRWRVKEAIERRRLELERGQVFGELPEIAWSQ